MKQEFDIKKPMQVGGQAVLEGVMMRAPGMIATAVRRTDGSIAVNKEPFVSLAEKREFFKLPVLRGAVGLIEMLVVGVKTLNYSAEVALQDVGHDGKNSADVPPATKGQDSWKLRVTVFLSLVAGIALFFAVPLFVATVFFKVDQEPFLFNLLAGGIRMAIFLAYLFAISRIPDVKRLFAYHGAEHKAVFAFERGETLEVASASKQTRFHPRCGTSFLLIVMLVAILLFAVLDTLLRSWFGQITLPIRLATHLPLLPLVGGVSYEFIRASAKRSSTLIGRIIVAPGLWLQRITTKEPDDSQLEVALAALRAALRQDEPVAEPANAASAG